MKLTEFKNLPFRDKGAALMQFGTLVGQAADGEYDCVLYSMGSFFVEVYGYIESGHFLAYHDSARLDKFLEPIDIEKLIYY